MAEAAPAVEQSRQRVREQRAAGLGPGDDLGLERDLARQDVEQILREPPDRRRRAKELVRVQIDAAVIAVAVVEVTVGHEHAERLHVLAGALAGDEMAIVDMAKDFGLRSAGCGSGWRAHGMAATRRDLRWRCAAGESDCSWRSQGWCRPRVRRRSSRRRRPGASSRRTACCVDFDTKRAGSTVHRQIGREDA